jgi:alpha-glucosidase
MLDSPSTDLGVVRLADGFEIRLRGEAVMRHRPAEPAFFVGHGLLAFSMYRGNFEISDYCEERVALRQARMEGGRILLGRWEGDRPQLVLRLEDEPDGLSLCIEEADEGIDRVWLRLRAGGRERVWGCGEQMSYFDLRGRRFPLWTSEPGVGRDKSTEITWRADVAGRAGGDYWHTNYPQPTYLSSRRYYAHLETSRYAVFDFRHEDFHEIEAAGIPERLVIGTADDWRGLVGRIADRFGRQRPLPDWIDRGVILGLKRGEAHAREKLEAARRAGIATAGLWCEDWSGIRETSFGTRLFWNWQWQPERYPRLPELVEDLAAEGLVFLAYANPNLCTDGSLFAEAEAEGLLVRGPDGAASRIDFGEFDCGTVDFTDPDACAWYRERIIRPMLDLGIAGWMADFGEYLPTDVRLHAGDPADEHNRWPVRWARVNAEAIAEAGKTGEAIFFMRAGFTGVQRWCPLLWGGDQSVDFSRHDGIGTVITAALSSGLMGNAFHHSDIGGYTSLFGNVRTAELHMRWAEMAAFTAMMRTHETNRPQANLQWFDDEAVAAHLARMSRVFVALAPYRRTLAAEAAATGLPLQRPLFLDNPDDPGSYGVEDQFMLGPDLLVAPVIHAGATTRRAWLPGGSDWVHLWSGRRCRGGTGIEVPAPFGEPAVFWRDGSASAEVFARAQVSARAQKAAR